MAPSTSENLVEHQETASKRLLWFALGLLVISVCINYIDRGNLSVAGKAVSTEFGANPGQMGRLYSAFFWTYSVSLVFAGLIVDRVNVNWLYGGAYLLWSAATALTGLVTGFEMLFALRLALGVTESMAYPCYSKIIAGGFPEQQRGIANSLIDAGSKLGPALGVMICGQMLHSYGWRTMFVLIGSVSMVWVFPWAWVALKQKAPQTSTRKIALPSPPVAAILSHRSAWGTFLGLFCYNYTWYFLITWLPTYLQQERHYTTDMLKTLGSLPFWGVAIASLSAGSLSDHLIRRGMSPTKVRKGFLVTGLLMATLILPAQMVTDNNLSMVLLLAACVSMGLASSNVWALTQRLSGVRAAGKWTGLQNGCGNLGGVAAPWVTGTVVQATGSFFYAFLACAGIVILGAMSYLLIVGPVEEIEWASPSGNSEPSSKV